MDLFSSGDKVYFIDDSSADYSFEELPYLFHDPHKLDKKIDVKKLQFGSKIDSSENKREDIFGVKEVLSPERIELSNGLKVKLLGIKENPQYTTEAVEFLKQEHMQVYLEILLTKSLELYRLLHRLKTPLRQLIKKPQHHHQAYNNCKYYKKSLHLKMTSMFGQYYLKLKWLLKYYQIFQSVLKLVN